MNSPHVSFRSCSFYIIVCYLFIIYNHSFICLLDFVEAQLQANITQTTVTMSQGRGNLAATSSGELVFFGGGNNATGPSDRVDIYNVTSGRWTTATLSVPRYDLAAASAGNLVFFAGGFNLPNISFDRVDIYNVSHGSWSTATLSQARYALAATSVGDSVIFGGGYNFKEFSVVVDIYNVTTNTWTTATLSTGRYYLTATSAANRYAFFAGGSNGYYISTVDICDTWRGTWKVSSLSLPRTNVVAASVDTLVFFAGGRTTISQMSNIVDIFNVTSDTWSIATLSEARAYFTATSFEEIAAFGGGFTGQGLSSVVDIYNGTSGLWSTLHLSQSRYVLASSSARNKIFFAGGSNVTLYLSVVDILCLDRNCPPPPLPSTPSTSVSPSNTDTFFSAGLLSSHLIRRFHIGHKFKCVSLCLGINSFGVLGFVLKSLQESLWGPLGCSLVLLSSFTLSMCSDKREKKNRRRTVRRIEVARLCLRTLRILPRRCYSTRLQSRVHSRDTSKYHSTSSLLVTNSGPEVSVKCTLEDGIEPPWLSNFAEKGIALTIFYRKSK
jgi:hypothetical protein